MPFVWVPGELPMFLRDSSHLQYISDISISADRVEGHVPIFREQVRFVSPSSIALPGFMSDARKASKKPPLTITDDSTHRELMMDPGIPSKTASSSRDVPPPGPPELEEVLETVDPVVAPEGSEPEGAPGPDDEDEEPLDREARLLKEAASLEHRIAHFPKNPACKICSQARMYARRINKSRLDPFHDRGALPPVAAFGERVSADIIVVFKETSSDERESTVPVVRDEFSGFLRAFPLNRRTTENVMRCSTVR